MSIPLNQLTSQLESRNTMLLFGAGSSIPSGAPSSAMLIEHYSKEFQIQADGYSLSERQLSP
jgi:hypothetical protein